MVCIVGKVVVDRVQQRVASDLGTSAAGVGDVVALERDLVVGAKEVDTPVGVAIARSGIRGFAVDEVVGDSNSIGGAGSKDNVLASDASGLLVQVSFFPPMPSFGTYGNMIDPDHVTSIQSYGVSSPDVLGVDVGDGHVPVMSVKKLA